MATRPDLQREKTIDGGTLKFGIKPNQDPPRDCNPGLEFSIPGFGIGEFPIPGSRDPVGIGRL